MIKIRHLGSLEGRLVVGNITRKDGGWTYDRGVCAGRCSTDEGSENSNGSEEASSRELHVGRGGSSYFSRTGRSEDFMAFEVPFLYSLTILFLGPTPSIV